MVITAANGRWSFSLRTLFVVVTIVAGFIAYHANWIRQRREAIAVYGGIYDVPDEFLNPDVVRSPGLLWLFGERGVREFRVSLPDTVENAGRWIESHPEVERIKRLFPEAEVQGHYTRLEK